MIHRSPTTKLHDIEYISHFIAQPFASISNLKARSRMQLCKLLADDRSESEWGKGCVAASSKSVFKNRDG